MTQHYLCNIYIFSARPLGEGICKPLKLKHGRISYHNDRKVGSRAVHHCDKGYILGGRRQRICMYKGLSFITTWSGTSSLCTISCKNN